MIQNVKRNLLNMSDKGSMAAWKPRTCDHTPDLSALLRRALQNKKRCCRNASGSTAAPTTSFTTRWPRWEQSGLACALPPKSVVEFLPPAEDQTWRSASIFFSCSRGRWTQAPPRAWAATWWSPHFREGVGKCYIMMVWETSAWNLLIWGCFEYWHLGGPHECFNECNWNLVNLAMQCLAMAIETCWRLKQV